MLLEHSSTCPSLEPVSPTSTRRHLSFSAEDGTPASQWQDILRNTQIIRNQSFLIPRHSNISQSIPAKPVVFLLSSQHLSTEVPSPTTTSTASPTERQPRQLALTEEQKAKIASMQNPKEMEYSDPSQIMCSHVTVTQLFPPNIW